MLKEDSPKCFLLGDVRCTWMKEPVVINQTPHIPFNKTDERCAYSLLLLHHPWPEGGEEDLIPDGRTAADHLKWLEKQGELSRTLETFIRDSATLEENRRSHGNPLKRSSHDCSDDDGLSEDEDDEGNLELDGGPLDDVSPHIEPLPKPAPSANGLLVMTHGQSQFAHGHISKLQRIHTKKMMETNMLTDNEMQDRQEHPSRIYRYQNHENLLRELEQDEEMMASDPRQKHCYEKIKEHIVDGENQGQLRMVLSGSGGTGKTLVIHSAVKLARTVYGKTESLYGPVLVLGPTGCAAYNAGGFTWQSALNKSREGPKRKVLSEDAAQKLENKLAGLKMVIFDEYSMASTEDLVEIEERLRLSQRHSENKEKLFGGLHVLFCGDFFQLPPGN